MSSFSTGHDPRREPSRPDHLHRSRITHSCRVESSSSPSDVVGNVTGWIRPNQDRDCFGDFAIAVYVNAADEIKATNFVLSGP